LTSSFPDLWPFFLGGLFIAVVLLVPDGLVGLWRRALDGWRRLGRQTTIPEPNGKG